MIKKLFFDFLIIPIFRVFDYFMPKSKTHWAFSVHHIKSDQFIENQRAVFEEVKCDASIHKVIFTRDDTKDFDLEDINNTTIVKLHTLKGLFLLSRCKVLFLTHSISMDFSIRYGNKLFSIVKPKLSSRVIINLWHGVPIKRLLALTNENVQKTTNRVSFNRKERGYYDGLITSSDIDSYAMATMFHPIKYENVWLTGLPRNDFLLQDENKLPKYLKSDVEKLKSLKKEKRLILYAPTYRQTHILDSASYYQFSKAEMDSLRDLLLKHNAILGFRMHYFKNSESLFNFKDYVDDEVFFDLGHENIKEIAAVVRASDMVVTDYSSVYIDAMFLDKPVFSFAYDLEDYIQNQDGLLYDIELAFPSEINTEFKSLLISLDDELKNKMQTSSISYAKTKKMFFKYTDSQNAKRLLKKINQIDK
jgi:CDP-glycerol glycerophosphotransferase